MIAQHIMEKEGRDRVVDPLFPKKKVNKNMACFCIYTPPLLLFYFFFLAVLEKVYQGASNTHKYQQFLMCNLHQLCLRQTSII